MPKVLLAALAMTNNKCCVFLPEQFAVTASTQEKAGIVHI